MKDKEQSSLKKEHKNEISIKKESSDFVTVKKEAGSKDRLTNDLYSPKHVKIEDEDFASHKKLIVSSMMVKSEPESDDDIPLVNIFKYQVINHFHADIVVKLLYMYIKISQI